MINNIFFSENNAVYEITYKNMVQPDSPHVTIRRKRFGYKHTLRTRYTYRSSTAIIVTRTRIIVILPYNGYLVLFSKASSPVL